MRDEPPSRRTHALLLAGSPGIRLRPLTDTIPKCLVPIDDRSLLDFWLESLAEAGIPKRGSTRTPMPGG